MIQMESVCLASVKPRVQIPVLQKKNNFSYFALYLGAVNTVKEHQILPTMRRIHFSEKHEAARTSKTKDQIENSQELEEVSVLCLTLLNSD
jgi:hypothetical protein